MKLVRVHARNTSKARQAFSKRSMAVLGETTINDDGHIYVRMMRIDDDTWVMLELFKDITFKVIGDYVGEATLDVIQVGRRRTKPKNIHRALPVEVYTFDPGA